MADKPDIYSRDYIAGYEAGSKAGYAAAVELLDVHPDDMDHAMKTDGDSENKPSLAETRRLEALRMAIEITLRPGGTATAAECIEQAKALDAYLSGSEP